MRNVTNKRLLKKQATSPKTSQGEVDEGGNGIGFSRAFLCRSHRAPRSAQIDPSSTIDSAGLTDDEDVRSLVGVFSILGGNSADHADLPRENVRRLTNVINDVGCIACPEVAEHPVHRYGERANRRVEYGRVAATALRVSPVIHA